MKDKAMNKYLKLKDSVTSNPTRKLDMSSKLTVVNISDNPILEIK